MKKIAAITLPTLVVLLAACGGGGGGGRPSADDLSKALNDHGNRVAARFTEAFSDPSARTIDCIARVLHGSKVSDGSLKAIVDGDDHYRGSHQDSQALQDATLDMAKCISK